MNEKTWVESRNAYRVPSYTLSSAPQCLADLLTSFEQDGCTLRTSEIVQAWISLSDPQLLNTPESAYLDVLIYQLGGEVDHEDPDLLKRALDTADYLKLAHIPVYVHLLELVPDGELLSSSVPGLMEQLGRVADLGDKRLTTFGVSIVLNKLITSGLQSEVNHYRDYLSRFLMQTQYGQYSLALCNLKTDAVSWVHHANSAFTLAGQGGHKADRALAVAVAAMERCTEVGDFDGCVRWALACEPYVDYSADAKIGFDFAVQLFMLSVRSPAYPAVLSPLADRQLTSLHRRNFEYFHRSYLVSEETLTRAGMAQRALEYGLEAIVSVESCIAGTEELRTQVHGAVATNAEAAGAYDLAAKHSEQSVSGGFESPHVWRVHGISLGRAGRHAEAAQVLCACSQRFVSDVGWPAGFEAAGLASEQYYLSAGFAGASEFVDAWCRACSESHELPAEVKVRLAYNLDRLWADLYFRDGQFKKAIKRLKSAEPGAKSVGEFGDYLTMVNLRARSLMGLSRAKAAFKLWKETLASCDAQIRQGNLTDIVDDYAAALEGTGNAAEAHSVRAMFGLAAQ